METEERKGQRNAVCRGDHLRTRIWRLLRKGDKKEKEERGRGGLLVLRRRWRQLRKEEKKEEEESRKGGVRWRRRGRRRCRRRLRRQSLGGRKDKRVKGATFVKQTVAMKYVQGGERGS